MTTLDDTFSDLSEWGRASLVILPALIALYLGVVVGASLVAANDDWRAVVGLSGYLSLVVAAPAVVAVRALHRGRRLARALMHGSVASQLAQFAFIPVLLAALAIA